MATGYILVDYPNPYTPQGVYPRRGGAKLSGTCIVHTSEGAWTSGVDALTRLVSIRSDYGCYHQACDWVDIAKYYPWEWETWQDSETNNWAVGIAAACKTSDWLTFSPAIREGYYRNMARMAADFVRYMRTKGIEVPRKRISGADARARKPGFCAHGDSGIARSDPGANFDWALFFKYTNEELDSVNPTGDTTKEPDMALDYGDKLFIQNEIERRKVDLQNQFDAKLNEAIARIIEVIGSAVWELKVFGQNDDEKKHVVTREVDVKNHEATREQVIEAVRVMVNPPEVRSTLNEDEEPDK